MDQAGAIQGVMEMPWNPVGIDGQSGKNHFGRPRRALVSGEVRLDLPMTHGAHRPTWQGEKPHLIGLGPAKRLDFTAIGEVPCQRKGSHQRDPRR